VVVEFQPSRTGRFYVNVGDDHLFIRRDHLVFENPERPLGGTWTGDDSDDALALAVEAAAAAVLARRSRHGEGTAALVGLVEGADDLLAGTAAALLGDHSTARARLRGQVHAAYRQVADEYARALEDDQVETVARRMTAQSREALALSPTERFWTP
jgi:hypothetical protein